MKKSRILVTGEWDATNRINFKITKTVNTGEGTLDFTTATIAQDKTERFFTEVEFDEYDEDFRSLNTVVAKYFIEKYNLNTTFDIQINID